MNFDQYMNENYKYNAKCVDVYDGDTCRINIDLGFGVCMNRKSIRFFGINTPELYKGTDEEKEAGKKARDFLREQILDKDVVLYSIKDKKGKYGRILGIICIQNENGELININSLLVEKGFAKCICRR